MNAEDQAIRDGKMNGVPDWSSRTTTVRFDATSAHDISPLRMIPLWIIDVAYDNEESSIKRICYSGLRNCGTLIPARIVDRNFEVKFNCAAINCNFYDSIIGERVSKRRYRRHDDKIARNYGPTVGAQ